MITSQLPTKNWHQAIGEATIADAICDRLVHNAHVVALRGASMRKKKASPPRERPRPRTDHARRYAPIRVTSDRAPASARNRRSGRSEYACLSNGQCRQAASRASAYMTPGVMRAPTQVAAGEK